LTLDRLPLGRTEVASLLVVEMLELVHRFFEHKVRELLVLDAFIGRQTDVWKHFRR
jgi:hypothetical protein